MAKEGRELQDNILIHTGIIIKPEMKALIGIHGSPESYLDELVKRVLRKNRFASNYYIDYLIDLTKAKVVDKDIWEAEGEWRYKIRVEPSSYAKDNIKIIEYKQ